MEHKDKLLFVVDEVGIGTSLLKHYAYSKKGSRVNVSRIPFLL